uniref:5-hydroxytryptamine receptor 3A-like n=1 Tax=Knipowitschia caucasica TaxID=637954 RepID=A0AAV2LBG1_KNICA
MMLSCWFLLLLFTGAAHGAFMVIKRPKGNSRPPKVPAAVGPPRPDAGSGLGEDPLMDLGFGVADPQWPDPCSYEALAGALQLKTSEKFQMFRPVKNISAPVLIYLEVVLYAILDVSCVNEHMVWSPEDHCGINKISLPTELLWRPDITIEELTEKGSSPPSPYMVAYSDGLVELVSDHIITSSCKMHVYKFPFDSQSCNLTFKSAIYSVEELNLVVVLDSEKVSAWTREKMRTQYEWLFVDITIRNDTVTSFERNQDIIVYTITMKRRSVLYIVNFLLPVVFFLILDLASFLMSDTGGEKLGFKITILLAVTVMQLLLNDILPSSSNRIPLIAVYCIGIFSLMLLSLMQSILVVYLINKDSPEPEADALQTSAVKSEYSLTGDLDNKTDVASELDTPPQ